MYAKVYYDCYGKRSIVTKCTYVQHNFQLRIHTFPRKTCTYRQN